MLFEPLKIRDVSLRNRIVVSPMCQYTAKDGFVADWHLVHLGKFAQGGAGAVFVEATAVEKRGRITHGDTGIWDDAHIAGLSRIAKFVKEQGAVPAIQLAHAGRKASMARPWFGNGPLTQEDSERGDKAWSTVAPTERSLGEGWITPRAMREGDQQTVVTAFKEAARRAHAAGFEMLEVHAAHGYLLHSFLSPLSNDGSREERMRFPLRVIEAVRGLWKKPLSVRISSIDDVEGGWSIEDTLAFANELKRIGVDIIDCSSGGILGSATAATKTLLPRVPGFQVPFAEKLKKR
jgi:2,4-dienoyl-CoA reductase-like NADH-dependent reductase (Old Yellow Enzyme family)